MKTETKRVTLMLSEEKFTELNRQASNKGISLPTYCRLLLSEFAEDLSKHGAATA